MMRVGNQTACWAATPVEPFDYALSRGFDAFEWFPDKKPDAGWDESDLGAPVRQRIRAEARGMRMSVHARWQTNLLDPESLPLISKDVELALDLGAALLNIHLFHERGIDAFVRAIGPLVRRTAEAGLQLAVENTPHHSPDQFNALFERLRSAGGTEAAHVGMCFDLGHANLCAATRNDYLGFLDRLDAGVPIIHLHFHENWGDSDSHLTLFTGPASKDDAGVRGVIDRLRRRGFSGSCILEQWPQPASLLDQARARLLELWGAGPADAAPAAAPGLPTRPRSESERRGRGPDFAGALAAGNERCRSWREKLELVRGLLAGEDGALTADQLADVAVYLRFLNSGEIPCVEDGRHFRPAHHARVALQIRERLARSATPETVFLARKILPWLPSSAPEFQRPEPLTRIRDIAHRNDLDPELKREIKQRLQNKLHRCAGPEDLATSAGLLERITAPGASCSPAFVEQFTLFHEELKEFFNARSLDERLSALAPSAPPAVAELIARFLRQKAGRGSADRREALRTLTQLRERWIGDAGPVSGDLEPEARLAEIGLEDFAFVLLSEIINAWERRDAGVDEDAAHEALVLALRNLALSGVHASESEVVGAELRAWGAITSAAPADGLLRLRATLFRCRRLAEDFAAETVALLSARAETLGRGLGVAGHAIRVYCESEIRAHVMFQVSRLATRLLHEIRRRLGLEGWEVLVGGHVSGRAREVETLESLEAVAGDGAEARTVALLRQAAGDEEIPSVVAGIVLAHELPHLSHLAVRARQAGVVLVACEESAEFESAMRWEGQVVSLLAQPDRVRIEPALSPAAGGKRRRVRVPQLPAVVGQAARMCIPIGEVEVSLGGGKAAGARRLEELSRLQGAGFAVPRAFVIPFGAMESRMEATPGLAAEYREQVRRLNGLGLEEFSKAVEALHSLVEGVDVGEEWALELGRRAGAGARWAVRSSANCEDIEGALGAGLYDSVMNVAPDAMGRAIRTVWASVWTRRAALSRRQAGIPHERVQMAVLAQEMVDAEYAFILHTVNPITHVAGEVYAEIVSGLGETLASAGTRGTPYRLLCDKETGATRTLAFANFSQACRPGADGGVKWETVDYSRVALSCDAGARSVLGARLAKIGGFVESALGAAQDIEGACVGGQVFLVQTRPQAGRGREEAP